MGRALSFEGESAPFVMYSHKGLLDCRKVGRDAKSEATGDIPDAMHELLRVTANYVDKLQQSISENKPHIFYHYTCRISHSIQFILLRLPRNQGWCSGRVQLRS